MEGTRTVATLQTAWSASTANAPAPKEVDGKPGVGAVALLLKTHVLVHPRRQHTANAE